MTKRLAVIIIVGVILIAATYFLTKPSEEVAFPEQLSKPVVDTANGGKPTPAPNGSADDQNSTAPPGAPSPEQGSTSDASQGKVPLQNQQSLNLADGIKAIGQALSIPGSPDSVPQSKPENLDDLVVPMPATIDATDKAAALLQARALAGRRDPFAPIGARKPFPRTRKPSVNDIAGSTKAPAKEPKSARSLLDENSDALPPPPDGDTEIAHTPDTVPVPPPAGITSDELPPPPDKPLLAQKLRLNGIVGNRAILAFKDRSFSRENGWRRYVMLGPGERFDSVKLVAIDDESVVLEEEGQQKTLQLPPIR